MRRLTLAEPWTVNVAGLVRSACSRLGVTCLLSLLLLPSAATHHGNSPYEVIQGRASKERVLPTGPTIGYPRLGDHAVATIAGTTDTASLYVRPSGGAWSFRHPTSGAGSAMRETSQTAER